MELNAKELTARLEALKQSIQNFDYNCLRNVIFMNVTSLYCFLSSLPCGKWKNTTIDTILNEIECYIPMGLSPSSMALFIEAAEESEAEDIEEIRKIFLCHCKLDFLNLIRKSNEQSAWQEIISTCQSLRQQQLHYFSENY